MTASIAANILYVIEKYVIQQCTYSNIFPYIDTRLDPLYSTQQILNRAAWVVPCTHTHTHTHTHISLLSNLLSPSLSSYTSDFLVDNSRAVQNKTSRVISERHEMTPNKRMTFQRTILTATFTNTKEQQLYEHRRKTYLISSMEKYFISKTNTCDHNVKL